MVENASACNVDAEVVKAQRKVIKSKLAKSRLVLWGTAVTAEKPSDKHWDLYHFPRRTGRRPDAPRKYHARKTRKMRAKMCGVGDREIEFVPGIRSRDSHVRRTDTSRGESVRWVWPPHAPAYRAAPPASTGNHEVLRPRTAHDTAVHPSPHR